MENKYASMTVNERLYLSGLMDEFDEAVQKKETETVRTILDKVHLTEGSIKSILEELKM